MTLWLHLINDYINNYIGSSTKFVLPQIQFEDVIDFWNFNIYR